ncbi:hypothetical protein J2S64_003764 [Paeniglutamicibacter sulfureus]|uniref:Uncharacterized protein n=1 Tax=Paeniglutamicibacter sulfureus TaxID=43666 RepID=A0ABU2BQP7_9MICC|nr:hypothetical protein [Paeniglutamicibacter sulfureus]
MTPRMETAPTGKGRGRNQLINHVLATLSTIPERAPEFIPEPPVFGSSAQIAALAGGGLS